MASQSGSTEDDAGNGPFDGPRAGSVKDSAQQIWLAGLGAFARAQAEGTKVFEALVKEGASMQKKTASAAAEKVDEVSAKMSGLASGVQAKYGPQWDKLETIFEERTAKALKRLGVPSAKDVDALAKRIDALSAQVAKLAKRSSPVKAANAAKSPTTKPAAKRTSLAKNKAER